jgi:stage III sporulation protein AG
MGDKKSLFARIMDLLPGGHKKPSTYQYVLIVMLIGIAFMLISNLFSSSQKETYEGMNNLHEKEAKEAFKLLDEKNSAIETIEKEYEKQLKEALESIVGVDDVTVVVNVDSTSEKVLEKNRTMQSQTTEEKDLKGGTREVHDQSVDEQVVMIRQGDQESPIVIKTEKPEIRGVLVVAKGAENIQIKKMIVEAVTRVLDVKSHRVAVLPKKTKGE